MNKLLTVNGILLLALMGFQQWFDCYWKAHGDGHINAQGVYTMTDFQLLATDIGSFLNHLCPFAPTSTGYFYFVVMSLIVPIIAAFCAKVLHLGKREIFSLLLVNPLLYFAVGFMCQPSFADHTWSWGQIAGPTIIGKQPAKEPLWILPAAVVVQYSALAQEKLSK